MLFDDYINYLNQYKIKYGNKTLILMEVGHFYELYGVENDTEKIGIVSEISELLNVQYTRRNKSILENNRTNHLMCGFPSLALKKYIHILLNNGYTVVMVDQVTPPPEPERAVTNIYSAGTYIDETFDCDTYFPIINTNKYKFISQEIHKTDNSNDETYTILDVLYSTTS